MTGMGLILLMIGASLADSASMMPSIVLCFIGMGLMYAGYYKNNK